MIDDYFARAHELVKKGEPFVTATVVRAEKPSSGKPGDRAIITADGVMHGWIGGSCSQPAVLKQAMKALADGEARFIRLSAGSSSEGARHGLIDLPMTCFSGGTLEIYIEPQAPRPRLLIVGTLPVARTLARLGAVMNYHVIVVDLDASSGEPGVRVPFADETLTELDEIGPSVRPATFVVVATHGNYDELALERILGAGPEYVGLVASPRRAAAVRDLLMEGGLTPAQLEPLKAPAGLDIQARRGDEIALSIMAEIVQRRRAHASGLPRTPRPAASASPAATARGSGVPPEDRDVAPGADGAHTPVGLHGPGGEMPNCGETAVDPICGMDVRTAGARHTFEHAGRTFYFCCPGCRSRFAREPELYLE